MNLVVLVIATFIIIFKRIAKESADNVLNIDMISIPRSYYSINEYNNIFQLDTNVKLGTTNTPITDITLTKGNYTANTLITEIWCNWTGCFNDLFYFNKKFSYLGMTGINIITSNKQKYFGFNTTGTWTPINIDNS